MTHQARSKLLCIAPLLGLSSGWDDAWRIPDPDPPSLKCQITSAWTRRDTLFAPEPGDPGGGGGGGNDEKKFTQGDVDRIVQDRVRGLNDKIKVLETTASRVAEIEKKLAETEEREAKAREEEALKGKSELDKLKIQLEQATEKSKTKEAEWAKKLAESESAKTASDQRFVDHVKRSAISDALLGAGLLKTASKDATLSFLSEANIDLTEDHQIKSITVGGKSFDKPAEAAKHFLTEKPYYAEPPSGGSGNPRHGGAPPNGAPPTSVAGLLSQGLAEMGRPG